MPQRSLYIVAALVIVTGAAYLVFDARSPEPPPPVEAVQPQPLPEDPPPPLPALADSDDEVRAAFSAYDLPTPWLARAGLLQRATTLLVNLGTGTLPRRQLAFLAPAEPFKVTKEGERFFMDPAGYARYTPLMDTLERVPPEQLGALLRRYEPLLAEALGQLGERDSVARFVTRAADEILARRPVSGRIELVRPNVLFQYANPALEEASELDKQLLRVGPENLARLQRYVQRVRSAYET